MTLNLDFKVTGLYQRCPRRIVCCHQAPDWAVATGRKGNERERECETTLFVFSNQPVYSVHSNLRYGMKRSVSVCIHVLQQCHWHRVPAESVPRGNDQLASSLLPRWAARNILLDNTKEKKNQAENSTHSNASSYIRVSYRVCQPKRSNHLYK